MPIIDLPGNSGSVVVRGTIAEADKMKAVLNARHAFALKYCQEQGWTTELGKLSIEQILQIRAQEDWKNPTV
jgi:hypothetical protein